VTVVTDKEPDDPWREFFNERNIAVIYPGSNERDGDNHTDDK
jgi:hypothetical protein